MSNQGIAELEAMIRMRGVFKDNRGEIKKVNLLVNCAPEVLTNE